MKTWLINLALLSCLTACSSKPLSVNYYLLNPPQAPSAAVTKAKQREVNLDKLIVADYLQQSSLVMQLEQNQLYFSRQDVWAQSLESAIYEGLLSELNTDPQVHFSSYLAPVRQSQNPSVRVQIEHFQATSGSQVICAGRYWISHPQTPLNSEKLFYFARTLTEDGYGPAVAQLRQTLSQLASQIRQDLQDIRE